MTDYHNDFGAIPVRREAYASLIDANEMAKNDYYYYKAGREHADEEAYKMSAELEWYKKFHDYIHTQGIIQQSKYEEIYNYINYLCGEGDE